MQDFLLHFPLHIVSWFFTGCFVLMGSCLIIRWHNKNDMRVGRVQVPLGWNGAASDGNTAGYWGCLPVPHFTMTQISIFFLKRIIHVLAAQCLLQAPCFCGWAYVHVQSGLTPALGVVPARSGCFSGGRSAFICEILLLPPQRYRALGCVLLVSSSTAN